MNKRILLSVILLTTPTISFAEKIYSADDLIERDGIYHEKSSNNLATGTLNIYRENGKLQSEVNYRNGKESGAWQTYDDKMVN